MKKTLTLLALVLLVQLGSYSQTYKKWDYQTVDKFYEKVSVKNGTLSEDGKLISCVFVPSSVKVGTYEVSISDFKNEIYEIKGTNYFVKFQGYFGYAGYGKEGILEVSTEYSATFYKKP